MFGAMQKTFSKPSPRPDRVNVTHHTHNAASSDEECHISTGRRHTVHWLQIRIEDFMSATNNTNHDIFFSIDNLEIAP